MQCVSCSRFSITAAYKSRHCCHLNIFISENVPNDRKDFLPGFAGAQRLGLILVFMNCSRLWSEVIRDIQAFFATDARRKLYWLYLAHPFWRVFIVVHLTLLLSIKPSYSKFHRNTRKKSIVSYVYESFPSLSISFARTCNPFFL